MRKHTDSTDRSQRPQPPRFCTHHVCRCQRAAELAAQDRIMDAIGVHDAAVRCRRDEREGLQP